MTGLSQDSFLGGVVCKYLSACFLGWKASWTDGGVVRRRGRRWAGGTQLLAKPVLFVPLLPDAFPPSPAPCLPPRLYDSNPFKALGGVTSGKTSQASCPVTDAPQPGCGGPAPGGVAYWQGRTGASRGGGGSVVFAFRRLTEWESEEVGRSRAESEGTGKMAA